MFPVTTSTPFQSVLLLLGGDRSTSVILGHRVCVHFYVVFAVCSLYLERYYSHKYLYASLPHFIQVCSHQKGLLDQLS